MDSHFAAATSGGSLARARNEGGGLLYEAEAAAIPANPASAAVVPIAVFCFFDSLPPKSRRRGVVRLEIL